MTESPSGRPPRQGPLHLENCIDTNDAQVLKGGLIHTMGTKKLEAKVLRLRELQAKIDQLEAEAEVLKDEIKEELTARKVDELTAGVFKVRWAEIKSKRFDSSALKAAQPELYAAFTRETTIRRFTVA